MTARERRKAIIELLCTRRCDKRENLAREFGVSKRTIDYDVEHLSADYPIYTSTGKNGGIWVIDGFSLNDEKLSHNQQVLLEKLQTSVSAGEAQIIESIIKKFGFVRKKETDYDNRTG